MRTAGRTVLFSAVTVAAAMAALLVFPLRFLYSMGVGGVLVALGAAFVSLTVLPALLAALGPRVNALGLRRWQVAMQRDAAHVQEGGWYRLSRAVMRRPGPIAIAAAALLIVMGLPFLRIEFTGVDASVLPQDRSARVVDDALRAEFPPGPTSPVSSWPARASAGARRREATRASCSGLDGVAAVARRAGRRLWLIDVVPERRGALGLRQAASCADVRALDAPFPVQVGGETAGFLDQQTSLGDSLPLALAILATTTLVILFLMTGSVVLPVKALIMNLLTVSAAFGLLVLIFQDGRLEGLLAYDSQGALEATQPILLFASPSGSPPTTASSCSRASRRRATAGLGDRESVAVGLERTGRIVTYAALLFCIAIGAFATSEVVFIKEVGVGTALAVLIDAFLVRALLVPSLMALLGRWNWWAPRPLARLHARLGLQERVTLGGRHGARARRRRAAGGARSPSAGGSSAGRSAATCPRSSCARATEAVGDPGGRRARSTRALPRRAAGRAGRLAVARRARGPLDHGAEPAARAGGPRRGARAGGLRGVARGRAGVGRRCARPRRPPPEDCPPVPRVDGAPPFHERFDLRWVEGGAPGRAGRARAQPRLDAAARGGPFDHLAVDRDVRRLDARPRSPSSGRFAIVPTFDLTIHFRAPLPAPGEWLLADYRSRFSAGGAWEEDGELWAPDGTLVAQSRQLAMIRERR